MSEEIKQIASRITELRQIFDYSADEIAKILGIAPELYAEYEEKGVDIPISVLYELANIYKVDFTEILTGKSPKLSTYCVVKNGAGVSIDRYAGYKFESLAYKFQRKMMEPLMVTVEPSDKELSLIVHPGQEFNYVVDGTIMVVIGDEKVVLEGGDSIYFDPTIPHGQKAMGGKRAKFMTVIAE